MNVDDILKRLKEAGDDPAKTTLAVVDIAMEGRDPALRRALEVAAIPHWFDGPILEALLDSEDAERAGELFEKLTGLSFVEPFEARKAQNVHEATRLALRKQLQKKDPERFRELSRRAARKFGIQPADGEADTVVVFADTIERVYHLLIAEPVQGAARLRKIWIASKKRGRVEEMSALAVPIEELVEHADLESAARGESVFALARIREDYQSLARTKQLAEEAANIFDRLGQLVDSYMAFGSKGDVHFALGELEKAESSYGRSQDIKKELVAQNPGNDALQRDLSVGYDRIGDVQQEAGELREAERSYRRSLEIREKLVEQDPGNSTWQRDLSVSHNKIGDVQKKAGDLTEASGSYRRDLEIAEKLAAQDPGNWSWQCDHAESLFDMGDLALESKDFEAAETWIRKALEILEKLTVQDSDRTNAVCWTDLAKCRVYLGRSIAGQKDRTEEARKELGTGLEILRELKAEERLSAEQEAWESEWEAELAKL